MKKIIAGLCAVSVAVATLSATIPANAAQPVGGKLLQVAQHNYHRAPPRFEMRNHYAYYNGHRGDRHYHRGWRLYNGYYFPPAAFVGAAIGAAILGGIIRSTR